MIIINRKSRILIRIILKLRSNKSKHIKIIDLQKELDYRFENHKFVSVSFYHIFAILQRNERIRSDASVSRCSSIIRPITSSNQIKNHEDKMDKSSRQYRITDQYSEVLIK